MRPYLRHLLADLRAAHDRQPPSVDPRLLYPEFAGVPDELRYAVEWETAPDRPLPDLFGVPAEAFPPPGQLSVAEMGAVVQGILDLWHAWDIDAEIPAGAPPELRYRVLRDFWRSGTIQWMSDGLITLEFCEEEPEICPWGNDLCRCKE